MSYSTDKSCTKMLRLFAALLLAAPLFVACNTNDPDYNAPVFPERIDFTANRQYPEGITYAPSLDRFLVSSLTQGKIGTVDAGGRYADLIAGDNNLICSMGMKVQDNLLYVCNSDQGVSTKSTTATTQKTAGLFVYNLTTGAKVRQVDLASLLPGVNHMANDVALDAVGTAYVTDSFAPVIYRVANNATTGEVLVNAPQSFSGSQINLNGIVYHPDNFLLVVKSNDGKLFKVDLKNNNTISEVSGVNLPSGDGMVLYNNDLYVVNNRTQVSQVRSTDGWKTASIVKTDVSGYADATTNVVVNDQLYSINARISEVSAAAAAKNPNLLQANTYSIVRFK